MRAEAHLELFEPQATVLTIPGAPDADASDVTSTPVAESASAEQDRAVLAAELAQARKAVDALTNDLRGIDDELDRLAPERLRHALALDIVSSLDKLAEIGGAAIFWGEDGDDGGATASHLRRVRRRVDEFNESLDEIEGRRAAAVDRIRQHQSHTEFMEDLLFEALEEEERLKQEWIVEREIGKLPAYKAFMPWSPGGEDDRRFRKTVGTALLLCLMFASVLPFIELPQSVLKPEAAVPERIVRLLLESQPKPPTPVRELPKPKPEEKLAEKKPTEEVPKVATPKPDKKVTEPAATEQPQAPTEPGLLAFRDKFAGLQEDQALSRLGSQAQINSASDSGPAQRAMVTTNAPGSSGGINLASLSRNVSGSGGTGGMARVAITHVTSAIGGIGKPGADRPLSGESVANARTDEEIQIVFDRYKASLYRLYNRELRKDPTLRGQMVLKLTIEPDGSVSLCQLQSSDMNAPELSQQVVERVTTIDFGPKDVAAITILYPIDFLPAA